jgi:hypothetical protein
MWRKYVEDIMLEWHSNKMADSTKITLLCSLFWQLCIISVHTPKVNCMHPCVLQQQHYALLGWRASHYSTLSDQISRVIQISWNSFTTSCPQCGNVTDLRCLREDSGKETWGWKEGVRKNRHPAIMRSSFCAHLYRTAERNFKSTSVAVCSGPPVSTALCDVFLWPGRLLMGHAPLPSPSHLPPIHYSTLHPPPGQLVILSTVVWVFRGMIWGRQ